MKKSIYVGILIFSLFFSAAVAQTPGYMGKHMTIGYSNNFFPAFVPVIADNDDLSFNSTHSFNIEYTIKNRTNFCISYQRLKTYTYFAYETYGYIKDDYGNNQQVIFSYNSNAPVDIISNNICLGLKFFNSGMLAPVGKYRKFELVLLFPKITYKSNAFETTTYDYNYTSATKIKKSIGPGSYTFHPFALTYTIGRQRVLFDRLVLDYGFQLGFMPQGLLSFANSETELSYNSGIESYCRAKVAQRLFRFETFNFHLGLGFLAF